MSVLGTMMVRAGLLSEGQAAAANEHAASRSSSHVDAILELGLADEDTLVAFLASKLMIPRVRPAILDRTTAQTAERVPPVLAWEYKVMPVSADESGNLTLAMADPTDMRAVRAVAEATGAYLVRAIASASNIRRALVRHYGDEREVRLRAEQDAAESDRPTMPAMPAVDYTPSPLAAHGTYPSSDPNPSARAPYMAGGRAIHDDDDAVPVRSGHAAAEEVGHEDDSLAPTPIATPAVPAPVDRQHTPVQGSGMPGAPSSRPTHTAPARFSPPGAPVEDPAAAGSDPSPPATAAPYMTATASPPASSPRPAASPAPAASQPSPAQAPAQTSSPAANPASNPVAAAPTSAPRPARSRAHTPWNPPLQGFNAAPEPLSPEAFAAILPALERVQDRDGTTTLVLDFLGAGFSRVILFVHSHSELRGHDARGKDLLVEAVRQVRIPTSGRSMFSDVIERRAPYFGPMNGSSKIDHAFSQALGGLKGNVLLLPITLGSKVPLLLWAHGTSHAVDPHSIRELTSAVSAAIHRIITATRRRG